MLKSQYKLMGGILLVAGTTIGAGMLALPVITGFAGFFPSIFLLALFWIYMTYTALLLLEVNLAMGSQVNIISMAKQTLGRPGEWIGWVTYLFLLYSLTTAYLAGSGPIIIDCIKLLTGYSLPVWLGAVCLLIIFSCFLHQGTRSVDYLNRLLMAGLAMAYVIMVLFLAPCVDISLLKHVDPKYLLISVAIVATSFGFHIIIPSLIHYLERNITHVKMAIWVGGLIPFIVYLLWELLTLGIIPLKGVHGLKDGYENGSNGAYLLSIVLGNTHLALVARCFSFFAILTSFLGVSLSLFDCLRDALKIEKTHKGQAALFACTFIPPLVFALSGPRIFLVALEYAGAFGVVILLGLFPPLMAWSKRYRLFWPSSYQVGGGKEGLIGAIIFSLLVILVELANQIGLIKIEMNF
ncbi:aromatic amino acid transport family protein [Neochlamydia sp. AcF95]|uniref:amino acid permease n=1 Tax=Neochlamydia sp. AcF95 TaxID=2795734 RepID=UPI001BC9EC8D|nr:aromatic amino acid transport family protein [Neochlamydia sp. AcF95]MBS4170513.1 Tyrosine-specific transport protein [Neochlamydia sp. AcF95]